MKFKKYIEEAQGFAVQLDSIHKDKVHFLSGIFSEWGELVSAFKREFAYGRKLDLINVQEELGDIMWFCVNLLAIYRKDVNIAEFIRVESGRKTARARMNYSSHQLSIEIIEFNSKVSITNKDMSAIEYALSSIKKVVLVANNYGFKMSEILEKNISKLEARNKGKTINLEAQDNRNTEKERKVFKENYVLK